MTHHSIEQALGQARMSATNSLDQPLRVGFGQWQTTPAQLSRDEIEALVTRYAGKLAKLHEAQVRLYRALLATDDIEAEFAAHAVHQAVAALPEMPDWPDTDEELIARLKGRFAVAPPLDQAAEQAAHDLAA